MIQTIMYPAFVAALLFFFHFVWVSSTNYPPEQVHIALGSTPDCITFNWVTLDNPIVTTTSVKWNQDSSTNTSHWKNIKTITNGTRLFIDNGTLSKTRTIHVITLCNLICNTYYYYQVGDNQYGWSPMYSFKTMPDQTELNKMVINNIPQKFVIFGDLGHVNAQTLPMMTKEGLSNEIDMILHVGDFAYDFENANGAVGDRFMLDIESLASHVPYMVSMGNHEHAYNFSHYSERFRGMPLPQNADNGKVWTYSGEIENNWYYSWNVGFIHFITISTEIYFNFPWLIEQQFDWLIKDLTIANNNRTNAPWIIINGHRPLYCTEKGDCGNDATLIRDGIELKNGTLVYGLENIFYQYGVDFYICGHEHNYERMYDIYKNQTMKTTHNMPATTYIVTGSAGCLENHDAFEPLPQIWDAFRTIEYSYTRFHVYNKTHVKLQQIVSGVNTMASNYSGHIIDQTWYVQEKHGPFAINYNDFNRYYNNKDDETKIDQMIVDYHANISENNEIGDSNATAETLVYEQDPAYHDAIPYLGNDKELYRGVKGVYF